MFLGPLVQRCGVCLIPADGVGEDCGGNGGRVFTIPQMQGRKDIIGFVPAKRRRVAKALRRAPAVHSAVARYPHTFPLQP